MKKIRVSWKYPDIYTRPYDPYMHEYFEVDDDATPEEIQNEAEDIAFEHFSWSFWDVTKEHEMTDDIKELQDLAKYYQNQANYYNEKATKWHKQADQDEAERERLIDLMNQIYVLMGHDPKETVDDLAEKLDQIKELTKKA